MHHMRTAYQQHHHGSPYGAPQMGATPPDYPSGMTSPSSAMAGRHHQKMSAPSNQQQQQGMRQPSTVTGGVDNAPEFNNNQEQPSNEGE